MPYVQNDGVRIHYEVEGQGPPLIMEHGWSFSTADFYEYGWVRELQASHTLILIDPRGHGYSDKLYDVAAYEPRVQVQDILAVMDALAIAKAAFLGISIAGGTAFALLRYAPARVQALLVGAASPYRWEPEDPENPDDNSFFYGKLREGMRAFYEWDIPLSPGLTVTDWFMCRRLANDPEALIACMDAGGSGFEDVIPNNTTPCLLFVGSKDGNLALMQRCAAEMPNSQLVVIPNRAHGELFRFTEPIPAIKRFLSEVQAGIQAK